MEPIGLNLDDQVTYYIGLTARTHVDVEYQLTRIFFRLCGPGLGAAAMPRGIEGVLSGVRSMFKKAPQQRPQLFPQEVVDEAIALLNDVATATATRNELVHDAWMPSDDEPGRFERTPFYFRPVPKAPKSMSVEDMKRCAETLERLSFRLLMLDFVLSDHTEKLFIDDYGAHRAGVRGEFEPDRQTGMWVRTWPGLKTSSRSARSKL